MNALVPQQQSLPSLTAPSKQLRTRLTQLSEDATDNRYPKRLTRAMVLALGKEPEVREALKFYRQSLAPAEPKAIIDALLGLELVYPSKELPREQKAGRFQIYVEALKDVPASLLSLAVERFIKEPSSERKFFPQPGELLAFIEVEMKDARRQLRGFTMIAAALDDTKALPLADDDPKNLTPEQLAKRRADVERIMAGVRERQRQAIVERQEREPVAYRESTPEQINLLKETAARRLAEVESAHARGENFYHRGES